MTKREKSIFMILSEPGISHNMKLLAPRLGLAYSSLKQMVSKMQNKYETDLIGLVLRGVELRKTQMVFDFYDQEKTSFSGKGSPTEAS